MLGRQVAQALASGALSQDSVGPFPSEIRALVESGRTMADAEQLASAMGATLERPAGSSTIQFKLADRSLGFIRGAYVWFGPDGVQPLDVAPFQRSGRLYVPLRTAVEGLGGKLTGSAASLSVQGRRGPSVPVKSQPNPPLPADPFDRLLARLENAPIQIAGSAKGALIGEAQLEVLDSSLGLMEPTLPALKSLGDSKVVALIGDLPGIGKPVQIIQRALGASGEVVSILKWYSSVDKILSQPLRKGTSACDKQLKSRSCADLDGTIAGLELIGSVAKEYQAMGFKAATAMLSYKGVIARFQKAIKKLSEARGKTISDPTKPQNPAKSPDLTAQIEILFPALQRQANDLDRFSKDCLEDARAAKAAGGGI